MTLAVFTLKTRKWGVARGAIVQKRQREVLSGGHIGSLTSLHCLDSTPWVYKTTTEKRGGGEEEKREKERRKEKKSHCYQTTSIKCLAF